MATKRQRGKVIEYKVTRSKLLPKPIYLSFENEAEGDAYVARLEQLLDAGVVPPEFIRNEQPDRLVGNIIRRYLAETHVPQSDARLLSTIHDRIGGREVGAINYPWAEAWIAEMKRVDQLSPVTIRHYVGALARCLDWALRKRWPGLGPNPLRLLPVRYASYSPVDAAAITGAVPEEEHRDRRLSASEEAAIRQVLAGERLGAHGRPLLLPYQAALECVFDLAIESAMRLREMFTLGPEQIDLRECTIFLDKTKNGDKRQVPLSTVALAAIRRYQAQVGDGVRGMADFSFDGGRFFPWWDGEPKNLSRVTSVLSRQYGRIFDAAGCGDVHFHDLRHEATSRFYERTDLSDLEIAKITGHKDLRSLRRYANLRGSTLAQRLW